MIGRSKGRKDWSAGANERDYHLTGFDPERDLSALTFADIRQARAGDHCPRCQEGQFSAHRGIEVGQTFYLGTKYSKALNATYLDAQGQAAPDGNGLLRNRHYPHGSCSN